MRRYADGSDTEVEEKPKAQGKGKPSAQFLKFWEEVYDKGKKKVSNPNQATKKTHPNVSASTAMKTPAFQAKVKKEFKAWLQQDDKDKNPKSKSEDKEPAQDKPKGRSLANPKRVAEFRKLVSDECKKARAEIDKLSDKEVEDGFKAKFGRMQGEDLPSRFMSKMSTSEKRDLLLFDSVSKKMTNIWIDSCRDPSTASRVASSWLNSSASTDGLNLSHLIKKMGYEASYISQGEEKNAEYFTADREKELMSFMEDIQSFNQAVFDELGIKELTVFRGVRATSPPKEGEKTRLQTRGLSSWTASLGISAEFAGISLREGMIVQAKIPVERMLMSIATFSGTNEYADYEYEVSVMGAQELDLDVTYSSSGGKQASKKNPVMIPITEDNEDWLRKNRKDKTKTDKSKKNKKKASLSCLVLKVAQSNSHVRRLLISELGKTLRN